MCILLIPSTMKIKSHRAGEYTAPPAQGPRMRQNCGMMPEARVFRKKIDPYCPNPSWMRAPPESMIPMTGAPTLIARSITWQILLACALPRDPPMTVKSCE